MVMQIRVCVWASIRSLIISIVNQVVFLVSTFIPTFILVINLLPTNVVYSNHKISFDSQIEMAFFTFE